MPMPLLLVEQHRHAVPAGEHHGRPDQHHQGALAVHPPGPPPHQVAGPVLVPEGDAPDDRDHHGGARHRQNEVQARELVEDAVAVGREQAGQRHREDDRGPVGDDARGGQGAGLQEAGPHRFDAGVGLGVEEQLGAEIGPDRVGSQGHGGRHRLDDDLGRGGARDLGIVHVRALAAPSSRPIRSTAGRIWRRSSSPPSRLTWTPSVDRTSTPDTDSV